MYHIRFTPKWRGGQVGVQSANTSIGWKYTTWLLLLMFLTISPPDASAQKYLRNKLEAADPAGGQTDLPREEKLSIHLDYLDSATAHNMATDQMYAHLLLGNDYIAMLDYEQAGEHLNVAQEMALKIEDPASLGWTLYRKGILRLRLKDYEGALHLYEEGADLCKVAGDSLCMGETYEQISVMHAILDSTEQSQIYHDLAIPLLQKYGADKQLASAYNNFGIVLSMKGEVNRSIPQYEKAIDAFQKLNDQKSEMKARNNLADAYRRQHNVEQARRLYLECIEDNKKYGLTENLVSNYRGFYRLLQDHGHYEEANEYIDLYYEMRDSLAGNETKQKLAEMELQLQAKHEEYLAEKSKAALAKSQQLSERRLWWIGVMGLLIVLGAVYLYTYRKVTKNDLEQHRDNLRQLSNLLIQKNAQLIDLNDQIAAHEEKYEDALSPFAENIFDVRILTDADWVEFKQSFEKAYPHYIQQLRKKFPGLSDGEERLCLLIKLTLSTREIASILGISKDSVKKSRQRLRKKLHLETHQDLFQTIESI